MALDDSYTFEGVKLSVLGSMTPDEQDRLPYGVVGLRRDGMVAVYNAAEAKMAGLEAKAVIDIPFFDAVAQCMNNFMVAQRFEDEANLDEIIPYVLTLKMRPTQVRLRLLASPSATLNYILIER